MEYGIQMYSVRDLTEKNMAEALRQVASLGYRNVEFAGFFGHPAEEIRDLLAQYGLRASGTHTGMDAIADHFEETVHYHRTIGCKNIIVPGADLSCQEKLDAFVEKANRFGPLLEREGITLGYHNHAREFLLNADGSAIHEQLVYRTKLRLEIDTYWAWVGMGDPVALMERLRDRIHVIHIKDGDRDGNGRPLGMGQAPCREVWQKAAEMKIPMVVESETLTPSGMKEAEICMEYLRGMK